MASSTGMTFASLKKTALHDHIDAVTWTYFTGNRKGIDGVELHIVFGNIAWSKRAGFSSRWSISVNS